MQAPFGVVALGLGDAAYARDASWQASPAARVSFAPGPSGALNAQPSDTQQASGRRSASAQDSAESPQRTFALRHPADAVRRVPAAPHLMWRAHCCPQGDDRDLSQRQPFVRSLNALEDYRCRSDRIGPERHIDVRMMLLCKSPMGRPNLVAGRARVQAQDEEISLVLRPKGRGATRLILAPIGTIVARVLMLLLAPATFAGSGSRPLAGNSFTFFPPSRITQIAAVRHRCAGVLLECKLEPRDRDVESVGKESQNLAFTGTQATVG